jgi:hypothetical protein
MLGGCTSFTRIVKEAREPASVPLWHVTIVVPRGKKDPEAGEQLIAPHVPLGVGAG